MTLLATLSSSKARSEVLRTLFLQPSAVGVRSLAETTGTSLGSLQHALPQLIAERWVMRDAQGHYSLNRRHALMPYLAELLGVATNASIAARSEQLHLRAQSQLAFCDDACTFFARRGRCG